MTTKAFLTISWDISETHIKGPFDTREIAVDFLSEEVLGNAEMNAAILGPIPMGDLIFNGKWAPSPTDLDKSIARQWAVFETTEATEQWMVFGDDAEAFDAQPEPGKMTWIGNYEEADPAAVYKQLAADDYPAPVDGRTYVCVPVGVLGPTDWMRAAGDMLTKIRD